MVDIYKDVVQLLEMAIVRYAFKGLKLHPVTILTHPADAEIVQLVHKAAEYRAPTLCLLTSGLQKLVRIGLCGEQGGLTEFCRRLDLGPLMPFIP